MELLGFLMWHQTRDAGRATPATRSDPPARSALRVPAPLWWGMLAGSLGAGPVALFTLAHAFAPLPAPAVWLELIAAGIALIAVHATHRKRLWARAMVVTVPVFVMAHFLAFFTTACLHGCS